MVLRRIHTHQSWPLHDVAATRELERRAQAELPPYTLMQRAGLSVARLARAVVPHGRHAWIACGPGNNGGDGFEAALHLQKLGWTVALTWTGALNSPADAQAARERALACGLVIQAEPPEHVDLAIDALLGLGGDLSAERPASAQMRQWLERMHAGSAPVLAVDLPTGLDANTGASRIAPGRARTCTLSLLSLKPGLFTAQGRDLAGEIWFDDLGVPDPGVPPTALLLGADQAGQPPKAFARHASHKGSFGDVVVVGGQQPAEAGTSMAGAALLAARAALHHGAGRVFVALLGEGSLRVDMAQPELMFRPLASLAPLASPQVAVVGCGGGAAIAGVLPGLLAQTARLVLDADALNAVAAEPSLRRGVLRRTRAGLDTILTPHPLEAARLLGCSAAQVQADRLRAAQALAEEFGCVVALKGSGTVVATPGLLPTINATGNALLASAGTGDVLAGMMGSSMAQGLAPHAAALEAVHAHGAKADAWAERHPGQILVASDLLS